MAQYASGVRQHSINKKGRKGAAIQGAIIPEANVPAKKAIIAPQAMGLNINDVAEAAAALTNVTFDATANILKFERAPISGGSAIGLATVYGGNSANAGAGVTGNNVYSYPVPMSEDGLKLSSVQLPKVPSWEGLSIPSDYAPGDPLPQCPNGLSIVRLERPFSFGGSTWDANYKPSVVTHTTGSPPAFQKAVVESAHLSQIELMFDMDFLIQNAGARAHVKNTRTGALYIGTVSFSANSIFVNTSSLDPEESYVVTLTSNACLARDDTGTFYQSPAVFEQPVVFLLYRYTLAYALNRYSHQTFFAGDLVHVCNNKINIEDDHHISKAVLDIISNASTLRSPHIHAHNRYDYGGTPGGAAVVNG